MANYCHNHVRFSGQPENMKAMRQLFAAAPKDGVFMPGFIRRSKGHFLDVSQGPEHLDYRTFWSPNLPVMIEVAEHLGLDFVQRYQEPAMAVWGEASYIGGKFGNIRLVSNDHQLYSFDPACEQFEYQGKVYDEPYAIWDLLIEAKKQAALEPAFVKRLQGILPHIDLAGKDYTIDWRLRELRDTAEPWERIDLRNLEMTPGGDFYLLGYDAVANEVLPLDNAQTILKIPNELSLDMVAVAREGNLFETDLLLVHPVKDHLTADLYPRQALLAEYETRGRGL